MSLRNLKSFDRFQGSSPSVCMTIACMNLQEPAGFEAEAQSMLAIRQHIGELLALNAAAHAGNQGKDFALVAGEVHSLAQRSSQAAKETKDLVAASGVTVAAALEAQAQRLQQAIALLLDVAMETARSGDQGKGVALAASEVRTLAQHSSQAAREIMDLVAALGATVAAALEAQDQRLRQAVALFRRAGDGAAPGAQLPVASAPLPLR